MTFQGGMDAKHEILLERILEELRAQTGALLEMNERLDRMEKVLSERGDVFGTEDPKERRP